MLLRYRFSLLSAVLALALSLGACAPMEDAGTAPQAPVSDTDTAPNETPADDSQASAGVMSSFTATNLEGNEVDHSLFEDYKLTMVNVWATFCTPCISEMPELWGSWRPNIAGQGVQCGGAGPATRWTRTAPISDSQVETAREIVEARRRRRGLPAPGPLRATCIGLLARHHRRCRPRSFVDSTGAQVGSCLPGGRAKRRRRGSRRFWTSMLDGGGGVSFSAAATGWRLALMLAAGVPSSPPWACGGGRRRPSSARRSTICMECIGLG